MQNTKTIIAVVVLLIVISIITTKTLSGNVLDSKVVELEVQLNRTIAYQKLCDQNLDSCRTTLNTYNQSLQKIRSDYSNCVSTSTKLIEKNNEENKTIQNLEKNITKLKNDYILLGENIVRWRCCALNDVLNGNVVNWSFDMDHNSIKCSGNSKVSCSTGEVQYNE